MLDELLEGRRHDFLHEAHQKEIIAQYCSGLEAQLKNASCRDEARALLDRTCHGFERSCPSRIIRAFLVSYAESVFQRHWSLRP